MCTFNGGQILLLGGRRKFVWRMCEFTLVSVTKCHRLCGPDTGCFSSYSSGGQKSKMKEAVGAFP